MAPDLEDQINASHTERCGEQRSLSPNPPPPDLSTMHNQAQSPLFSAFPPEIRSHIFLYAVTAFPDLKNPYPFDSSYYRPGYIAPKRVDFVPLLLTCKQVYVEAKDWVWHPDAGNDEEALWWGSDDRRPPEMVVPRIHVDEEDEDDIEAWGESDEDSDNEDGLDDDEGTNSDVDTAQNDAEDEGSNDGNTGADASEDASRPTLEEYIAKRTSMLGGPDFDTPTQCARTEAFTERQWSKIKTIQIFPQMYAISNEQFAAVFHGARGLRPKVVRVTARYTDWWNWETDAPLTINSLAPRSWGQDNYYVPESCQTLVLELESTEANRKQLDEMVKLVTDNCDRWRWRRLDDEFLELDRAEGVKEWDWMGTTTFNGRSYAHHPPGEKMKYIVKVLTFRAPPTQSSTSNMSFGEAVARKLYEAGHVNY